MEDKLPIIGIAMGDPSGIGPEVTVKALSHKEIYDICRPLIVGNAEVVRMAIGYSKVNLKARAVASVKEAEYVYGTIDVLPQDTVDIHTLKMGEVSAQGGNAAYRAVETVVDLAMKGEIDATVTGPLNKEALNLAGWHYSGHTEIYADLTQTKEYCMMLANENFRIAHVSTHVSLREACDRCKKEREYQVIRMADQVCRTLGIENPRIAVAGLNPHSGENGLFGTEEIEEIIPAIEQARAEHINAEGPVPPDTVFSKASGGQYDIVVAQYHDQGHIPMKLQGFQYDKEHDRWTDIAGVNITLGLPVIRSSVDHGTAFDKAGAGTANEQSMLDAIRYGVQLASKRRKTEGES